MPDRKNLRCEEVVEHLLTFLDGETEAGRHELVEQHLEECRSCCSRADFELALRHRLREVATRRSPSTLKRKIKELIDQF